MLRQVRRHGDPVGQFVRRRAPVDPAHGLVVEILDGVSVGGEHPVHRRRAADRPAVMRDQRFRLQAAQPVDRADPDHRVAEARAAQGVDVGESLALDDVGRKKNAVVPAPDDDLVVGLARQVDEGQPDAGDLDLLLAAEGAGRRDEAAPARNVGRAKAGADIAALVARQLEAEGIHRPARQYRREQAAVARQVVGQFVERNNLDGARADILLGNEGFHAADMVRVDMGVDHGADRLVRDPAKGFDDRLGEFDRGQRIDEHAALIALDQRAVGRAVAVGDVIAAGDGADRRFELRVLAGETGVHGHALVRFLHVLLAAL